MELPPGPAGERRQLTKGGFETAREAADARAEVIRRDRARQLPSDGRMTLADWLRQWLAGRIQRKELSANAIHGYESAIRVHLIPHLGQTKLAGLRGLDITRAYEAMQRQRQEAIAKAEATNEVYAAEAEVTNRERQARGLRPVKPQRVAVPRSLGPVSIERIHACLSAALKGAVKAGLIGQPRTERQPAEGSPAEGHAT